MVYHKSCSIRFRVAWRSLYHRFMALIPSQIWIHIYITKCNYFLCATLWKPKALLGSPQDRKNCLLSLSTKRWSLDGPQEVFSSSIFPSVAISPAFLPSALFVILFPLFTFQTSSGPFCVPNAPSTVRRAGAQGFHNHPEAEKERKNKNRPAEASGKGYQGYIKVPFAHLTFFFFSKWYKIIEQANKVQLPQRHLLQSSWIVCFINVLNPNTTFWETDEIETVLISLNNSKNHWNFGIFFRYVFRDFWGRFFV